MNFPIWQVSRERDARDQVVVAAVGGGRRAGRLIERRKPRRCEAFEPSAIVLSPPPSADSGGGIRTRDLRVMSPTSYQTAPPRAGTTSLATGRGRQQDDLSHRARCPRRAGCRGGAPPRPARRRPPGASPSPRDETRPPQNERHTA